MTTIQIPALGRPFPLGMFYDSRKDQLIEEKVLWHPDELKNHIEVQEKPESEYAFTATDSLTEKLSFLDINTELKLSFMCGYVEVRGAAKYLRDRKRYTHQSRVSFKYRCTTHFEELLFDELLKTSRRKIQSFDDNRATHIVVGILYGVESIFLFDKTISTDEDVTNTTKKLEAEVKYLRKLSSNTDLSTDETHSLENDIQCTFYGDLKLKKNPTTFEEAVKVFNLLPSRIEKRDEMIPVTVWLYPLSKLSPRAPKLLKKVDFVFVNKIEEILENLAVYKMKCNDLLAKSTRKHYDSLKNEVERCRENISDSEKELVKKLSESVHCLRQSSVGNRQMYDILDEHRESTNNIRTLYSDCTKREKTLTAVEEKFQTLPNGLRLRDKTTELYDREEGEDPIVYIDIPVSFDNPENVLMDMRHVINNSLHLLKLSVSSDSNAIGIVVEDQAANPDPPEKPRKLNSSAHSIDIICDQLTPEPKSNYLVYFTMFDRNEWHCREFKNIDYPQFGINNLRADTCYIFRVKCFNSSGISKYSETSDPIHTKKSLGSMISKNAELSRKGSKNILRFPLKKDLQNDQERIRRYSSDHQCVRGNLFDEKIILVLGNSDCKIAELLDGMVNYVGDVGVSDSYRYTIGKLEEGRYINMYRLLHSVGSGIDYTVTIIDFSDVIDYDRNDTQLQIEKQLKQFFESSNGCLLVHGIVIAIPAKLNDVERSEYELPHVEAVALFGADIMKNVIYVITGEKNKHYDVDAYQRGKMTFNFDTAILFTDIVDSTQKTNWSRLMKNFKAFFQQIGKLDSKSIKLESTLKNIRTSEFIISDLQSKVQVCLSELHASRQEFQTLDAHKEDTSKNVPFSYEVTEIRIKHVYREDKQPSTYCLSCKVVCHKKCKIVVDSEKSRCSAMGCDGNCTVCENRCSWETHINPAYRSVPEICKVLKWSTDCLKDMETLKDKITDKQGQTVSTIQTTTNEINRMREDSHSFDEKISVQYFIDNMISVEEYDQYPGYEERIQELKLLRDSPDIMDKVERRS